MRLKIYIKRTRINSYTILYLLKPSSNQSSSNKLSLGYNKERNPDRSSLRNPLSLLVHLIPRSKLSKTFTAWTSGFRERDLWYEMSLVYQQRSYTSPRL